MKNGIREFIEIRYRGRVIEHDKNHSKITQSILVWIIIPQLGLSEFYISRNRDGGGEERGGEKEKVKGEVEE